MRSLRYGEELQVYTFTGWEDFDWDMYESVEEACEELSYMSVRYKPENTVESLRIECGEGKFAVHSGLLGDVPCLSVGNNGKGEVGLPVEGGEMPTNIEVLNITFLNEESVDVWIKHLTEVKQMFVQKVKG